MRATWVRVVRVAVLAFAVYVVLSAAIAAYSLLKAQDNAQQAQRALSARQSGAAAGVARSLGRDFFWARTALRGPWWWFVSKAPFVGDDVAAVRTMAAVGDELTHGAGADLVGDSSWEKELTPRSGQFDLEAIAATREPVDQTHFELENAVHEVGRVDPDHLLGAIRGPYRRFALRVRQANTAMATASRAVRVLPTMLGADGPRVYLLLFDNNAEIRATGGLPGQFAEIRADAGQLTMIKQGTATDIKASPQPLLTQSVAEKQVYGERMAEAFQDTNVTPEFPRTAELVRGMWSRFAGGEQLDGVWSLDTVSISYLLGATGPVKAPDGTELTKYNSTEALLHGIYVRTPDKGEQDEFFSGFAKNLFDKIVAGHAPPLALASALSASTIEGRTHVYDFHPEVRRQLAGTPLAGELPTGGRHPQVGVYLDNEVPSKLSYYLRTKVSVTARSCDSARQQLSGTARLTYSDQGFAADALNTSITGHGAPGTPIGEQRVLARLYGPAGGSITDVRVDGNTVLAEPVTDRGRPIVTVPVQLAPGHSVPVTWKMSSGKRQDRDPELSVTPGFDHVPALRVTPTRCHAG